MCTYCPQRRTTGQFAANPRHVASMIASRNIASLRHVSRLPSLPSIGLFHQQRRNYLVLQTTLNPRSSKPTLPKNLPAPPKTIILLTTTSSASRLTRSDLASLSNDGTPNILAAVVDALPGTKPGIRVAGHSWFITDHTLPMSLPPTTAPVKSLSFSFPGTKITFPLANTIFQTGSASTLVHVVASEKEVPVVVEAAEGLSDKEVEEFAHAREEVRESWEELGELMKLVGQRAGLAPQQKPENEEEDSFNIIIPPDVVANSELKFSVPLKPLTKPRKIEAGMGNILKQLSTSSGELEGASRELERVIPIYIDSLLPSSCPERVEIFARLTPTHPADDENGDQNFFAPNAKVHKVLSGGGGWGSKAGLLSLDPQTETEVSSFAAEFEASFYKTSNTTTTQTNAPRAGIVKIGEYVQFFVAEPPKYNDEETAVAQGLMRFGAVPKLNDELLVQSGEEDDEIVLEGSFGALVEGGVWITATAAGRPKRRKMDIPFGEVAVQVV